MEYTNELANKIKVYKQHCEEAMNATSFAEVDKAKVEGIKSYNELVRQVNRAGKDIYNLSRARRTVLMEQSYQHVQATVMAKATPEVAPAPTPLEEAVEAKTIDKAKKSKKAKK